MARFLLLAKSTGKSGRVRGDPVGVYKRSHVFAAMTDKVRFLAEGNKEEDWTNTFMIIDCDGISLREGRRMLEVYKRTPNIFEPEAQAKDDADKFVILGRHRWCFDIDNLGNQSEKDELIRESKLTCTRETFNSYIIDRTDANEKLVPSRQL